MFSAVAALGSRSRTLRIVATRPLLLAGRSGTSRCFQRLMVTDSAAEGSDGVAAQKKKIRKLKKLDIAKKTSRSIDGNEENMNDDSRFTTIHFGKPEDLQNIEMEERLKDAERWVSRRLSDEEASILNRQLGLEEEFLANLQDEDFDPSSRIDNKLSKKRGKGGAKKIFEDLSKAQEDRDAYRIKGFLEMNPYLCSGCGTPFQSKSESDPGFLPKEKMQEQRRQAELIKEKQEAIKILELAGFEMNSPEAEEILKSASVSPEVIMGVRALGRQKNVKGGKHVINEDKKIFPGTMEEDDETYDDADDDIEFDIDDLLQSDLKNMEGSSGDDVLAALTNKISKAVTKSEEIRALKKGKVDEGENNRNIIEKRRLPRNLAELSPGKGILPGTLGYINDETYQGADNSNFEFSADEQQIVIDGPVKIKGGKLIGGDNSHALEDKVLPICICQRCFRLNQYGKIDENLRPGWSTHELLTPERFETLLSGIRNEKAVVLCIIDIFDLRGSLLANLKSIAGANPIVIAANKADLLPKDASSTRLVNWIQSEIKQFCGLVSPRDVAFDEEKRRRTQHTQLQSSQEQTEEGILRRSNVHLVSCQSGVGMDSLMKSLMSQASQHGNTVYVMGAANVGKSSFINRLLDTTYKGKSKSGAKKGSKSETLKATVSNLPGTTLDFIKIRLPNGITMIDTPGLINKGTLTSRLNIEELRQVIPVKPVNAVTLRVSEGKCVLVGGLAVVELLEGRPFFFTFFMSNEVKLRPTDAAKAQDFLANHIGTLVGPPATPERLAELGPFETIDMEVTGDGWRKSETDIVIAGLGWVSVTGPGRCVVRLTVPKGTNVGLRPSLLPYEASHSTASFSGGRLMKKSRKSGANKGYGWRA